MKKTLTAIEGNRQRLDGGSMFGNAPRALWSRWIAPDDQNRIPLACRTLLVQERPDDLVDSGQSTNAQARGRNILFETGIGCFFEPKLRDRFGVEESHHVLMDNLAAVGVPEEEIDVVVVSHLHFDHAGGLLSAWRSDVPPTLQFPNARFVVGQSAWERANHPHPRDRASFIPDLLPLLANSGRLELVEQTRSSILGDDYRFHRSDGHTPGMLCAEISPSDNSDHGPVVYCADLIPGRPWVNPAISMGYDRFPELLIDEKNRLLAHMEEKQGKLFFAHDPNCAMASVSRDERGRFTAGAALETVQNWEI